MKKISTLFFFIILITSCKKEEDPKPVTPAPAQGANLVMKFRFDSTQVRLNNIGQPSSVPPANAAQSPVFNKMSAHYIELAPGDLTPVGGGDVLYQAAQTSAGGAVAIDFSQSTLAADGETFFTIPLSQVTAGTYKWLRVSLAYQNYDIRFKSGAYTGTGTIASFIGFNTYITNYLINTQSITVNNDMLQGYWGFEAFIPGFGYYTTTGQAPAGSTTVVNPNPSSPIPAGSCLVTGQFTDASGNPVNLVITGSETSDIIVTVSLSTNNSFEWKENSGDTMYEPAAGDTVVDMGIRGMIPVIN